MTGGRGGATPGVRQDAAAAVGGADGATKRGNRQGSGGRRRTVGGGSQSRRCSCKAAGGPRCGARGGLAQRASCLCNKASSRCLGVNWRAAARHRRTPGALERTLFLARFSFGLHPADESAFICPSDRQSSGETSGRTKRLSSGQTLLPEIQLGRILTVLLSVATISLILMMTKTAKLRTPVLLPPRLAPPRLAPPSPPTPLSSSAFTAVN